MSKVAVFGAGSWGTAFSLVLADAGNDVTIWVAAARLCDAINEQHENTDYFPGVELPETSAPRPTPQRPRRTRSSWCSRCRRRSCARTSASGRRAARDAMFVSLMKGVELGTTKRMSEVIAEVTGAGPERIAVVSGPNLAREIAHREPAASVIACADESVAAAAPGPLPLAGVPSLPQHRRPRLRARRRLQERGRAVRRDGDRARLRRQHHRLDDHPRACRDRPAGDEARRRPDDADGSGRAR